MTIFNKAYAYYVHKNQWFYECVYNIIDYMFNIRNIRSTLNQILRKGDSWDKRGIGGLSK